MKAGGVMGIFSANRVQDDIQVFADESRSEVHLRQQTEKPKRANNCLGDFVAPKSSSKADYFGAFSVIAGTWEDVLVKEYGNDYNSIMVKSLAD